MVEDRATDAGREAAQRRVARLGDHGEMLAEMFAPAGGFERVGRDQGLRQRLRRAARFRDREEARGAKIGGRERARVGDGIGIVEEQNLGLARERRGP